MRSFRPVGRFYVAGLDPTEREVFATVVADVAELLGSERFEESARFEDDARFEDGERFEDDERSDGARRGQDAPPSGPVESLVQPRMSIDAVAPPEDPAVRRLLPDASRDDDAVTAEFRRLTDADLRLTKIERLRDLWTALTGPQDPVPGAAADDDDDFAVPRDRAQALAAGLTDVRLVLAERLGLETEEDADRLLEALEAQATAEDEDDPDTLDPEALDRDDGRYRDDDRPAREIVAQEIRAYLGSVYAALTWFQESLMALLLADLDRSTDGPPTGLD